MVKKKSSLLQLIIGHFKSQQFLSNTQLVQLPDRSLALHNAVIRMCVQKGLHRDALRLFRDMIADGKPKPDNYTFPFSIKTYGELGFFGVGAGAAVHGRALATGCASDAFVSNSLLAMYMNCRDVESAWKVFDKMPERGVVSWNTMIQEYRMEGPAMCNHSRTEIRIIDDQGTQLNSRAIDVATSLPSSIVPDVAIHVASAQPRPSRELLEDKRALKELCVPLHKAAMCGDWETARTIIGKDRRILTSSITIGGQNVLHLAAGSKNVHFVEELVQLFTAEELELRDDKGNTAFCNAAATASVRIAEIMLKKNPRLVFIHGGGNGDVTPLYMAALFDHPEMAWYLYDKTKESLDERGRIGIFFSCINNGIYDLALQMLKEDNSLAVAGDDEDKKALHHLAVTPSAFSDRQPGGLSKLVSWLNTFKGNSKQTTALELVRCLWEEVLNRGHEEAMKLISSPSELLFDATKVGNFEFLRLLVSSYPDLVWKHDTKNRTMFHFAVLYRHADIFKMLHEIGQKKDVIATYVDDERNNMLHLAAMLPPPDRLNTVSGAALQMQKELLWFEEVSNNMTPLHRRSENKDGMSPEQLFSREHTELLAQGEKWLKDTSQSGLIVSTIITTVVFAAAFSLPGGNDNFGRPNDLHYTSFMVFVLSDGLAMLSSVVASLMFLSILNARYTEHDFRKSLPLKLITGLTALFFSNLAMMVAFSSTVAIACYDGLRWVPYLISLFAFVPIALFAVSHFPLWFDTFSSTYWSRNIFKPARKTLC